MSKYSRYKPIGWRGEPHRHYLAAKGISTKVNHRYFVRDELKGNRGFPAIHRAFAKGHSVSDLEANPELRSQLGVTTEALNEFKAQSKSSFPEGLSYAEGDIAQPEIPVIQEPTLPQESAIPEQSLSTGDFAESPGNVISTPGVPRRSPLQFHTGFEL